MLIASLVGKWLAAAAELLGKPFARLIPRRRDTLPGVDVHVSEPAVDRNATTVSIPKAGKLPTN